MNFKVTWKIKLLHWKIWKAFYWGHKVKAIYFMEIATIKFLKEWEVITFYFKYLFIFK